MEILLVMLLVHISRLLNLHFVILSLLTGNWLMDYIHFSVVVGEWLLPALFQSLTDLQIDVFNCYCVKQITEWLADFCIGTCLNAGGIKL